MKYRYLTVYDPSAPTTPHKRRPVVEFELFGPKGKISIFNALVDSGADNVLINAQFAELVGIDLSKARLEKAMGIDGVGMDTYFTATEIKIREFAEKIKLEIGFIPNLAVAALLGQAGFFDNYRIKFERDHNAFELNPAPKK